MSALDIPILVVDDAKFSSAIIAKVLRGGGFSNVRFTNNPMQALRSLEKRAAQILIADWLMPSMDGLELTKRVKTLDAKHEHFTYVMLLTARDEFEAMNEAFEQGVDDFLNKAHLRSQFLPRIIAAQRLAAKQNELLRSNKLLRKKIRELQNTDVVDPVTGLGNLKFTLDRLDAAIRQAESRNGAACIVMVGVGNLNAIEERFDSAIKDEVMSALGARLRGLVRPLDVVTRPDNNVFAVVTLQTNVDHCSAQSFKRIYDGLYMHSVKTSAGQIPVVIGVSICGADKATGFPNAKHFLKFAHEGLNQSFSTGGVHATLFDLTLHMKPATG